MSQKYATKLGGGLLKGVLRGILGIEGQKKLWKNQFYRLLKSIFFFFNAFGTDLVQLTQEIV